MNDKDLRIIDIRRDNVVDALTELLVMAKQGQIKGVIAAALTVPNKVGDADVVSIVEGVNVVQQRLLIGYLETNAVFRQFEANLSEIGG